MAKPHHTGDPTDDERRGAADRPAGGRRRRSIRWRGTSAIGSEPPRYPYLHPEALHSEPLAVSVDDLMEFLDHYGDGGPDIRSNVQPP